MKSTLLVAALLTIVLTAPAFAAPPQIMRAHPPFATGFGLFRTAAPQIAKNRFPGARSSAQSALHPDQFTIVDVPGAGTAYGQGTSIVAVNSSSVSSGFYVDADNFSHGFLRASDGTLTTFDADGATSQTEIWWINDHGAVVGDYVDPDTGLGECFLRSRTGMVELFDASNGGPYGSYVERIDNAGVTVGEYPDANFAWHAYSRARDGTIAQFDAPGAGTAYVQGTFAFDTNRTGTISGQYIDANNVYHGYLRAADGTFTEIDVPGAGTGYLQGTVANSINRKGWVDGTYIDANSVLHGFLRAPDGTITTFDAPDAGTGPEQGTFAVELTNRETIVGWYEDSNSVYHGFERSKNGTIAEFDALGTGTSPGLGTEAFDIARHNVISGWNQDDSGVYHGYLRMP
ncbi:MAG TPA: hypothetical protein VGI20_05445 [Rhizomicrobium sp.]|jgi:hypothetical protein